MKKHNLILSMLATAGLLLATGCSEETTNDPDPVDVAKTCQLTGIGEVSDGESYNVTLTYDANDNLISALEDGTTTRFMYEDSKLTSLDLDGTIAKVSYEDNDLPYRVDLKEDDLEFYFIMKSENGRYVRLETFVKDEEESLLQGVTNLSYNASGNIISVESLEYDFETEELEVYGTVTNITHDDKKNPYTISPARMVMELLGGNEANLGANNPINYTASYETEVDISNSYTYNEDGYPTKREESGYSSPTVYNFSYTCK